MPRASKRQNPAYEESRQPQKQSPYKKYLLIFLGILAVLFVIAAIVQQYVPIEEPPVQQNTWEGLTPGYTITPKLSAELGEPVAVKNLPAEKQQVSYKSEHFKAYTNDVIVNKDGVVEYIEVHQAYDPEHTFADYISLYGEPDLELYATEISTSSKAYIYLEEGVVVIAHDTSNIVERIWYFEPTDRETFMLTWGRELSTQSSHPEAFPGL